MSIFSGLLNQTGATIDCRQSGREALELLNEQNDYDLIFLDQVMPEMDGVELYSLIEEYN